MNKLYALAATLLVASLGAMDRPAAADAQKKKPMSEAEQKETIAWAEQYVRDNDPSFLQKLADRISEHKKLRLGEAAVPELTPEQLKERDKVTVDAFGRINLTQREKEDRGLADDPRLTQLANNDPYTVFSRKLERAKAPEGLIAQVMKAREQELKKYPHKDPNVQLSHPAYNTWVRQIEDNSKISEADFDQWLGQLCTQNASGKSVELTCDDAGDLITTRVFLYKSLPQDQRERATVGNLDHSRLSALQTMAQQLQLDFNVPRRDGQFPIQVALAHGRYQAASILVAGAFDNQAFARGPVHLQFTPEQQARNPLLITLVDSLKRSLQAYAYSKDGNGKDAVNKPVKRYLKEEATLVAYYMLEKGLSSELPAGLPDPIQYADANGFRTLGSLISLARKGQLKQRSELQKDSPALELVAKMIANTDKKTAAEHVEPSRLI